MRFNSTDDMKVKNIKLSRFMMIFFHLFFVSNEKKKIEKNRRVCFRPNFYVYVVWNFALNEEIFYEFALLNTNLNIYSLA